MACYLMYACDWRDVQRMTMFARHFMAFAPLLTLPLLLLVAIMGALCAVPPQQSGQLTPQSLVLERAYQVIY